MTRLINQCINLHVSKVVLLQEAYLFVACFRLSWKALLASVRPSVCLSVGGGEEDSGIPGRTNLPFPGSFLTIWMQWQAPVGKRHSFLYVMGKRRMSISR